MKRYFTYRRISPHETKHQSVSIQAQKDVIEAYLSVVGGKSAADFVDEKISASIPLGERPAGKRLLAAVQDGDCEIVVAAVDRMFRDGEDQQGTIKKLRQQNVQIKFVREGANMEQASGRLVIGMMALLAQFERDMLIERKLAANKSRKLHGMAPAGKVPYGFEAVDAKIDADGRRTGGRLVKNVAEQEVIRLIRQLSKRGKSLRFIAQALTEGGHFTRAGEPFAHTMVQEILRTYKDRTKRIGAELYKNGDGVSTA